MRNEVRWWFPIVMIVIGTLSVVAIDNIKDNIEKGYICTSNKHIYHIYDFCPELDECQGNKFKIKTRTAIEQGYNCCEWCWGVKICETEGYWRKKYKNRGK